jgi:hypothetical protein
MAKQAPSRPSERSDKSRSALVVGLAVAAVVLLVTMIYVGTRPSTADDSAASVELDSDAPEMGVDEPEDGEATPSTTATSRSSVRATPVAPRHYKPPPPRAEPTKSKIEFVPDDL